MVGTVRPWPLTPTAGLRRSSAGSEGSNATSRGGAPGIRGRCSWLGADAAADPGGAGPARGTRPSSSGGRRRRRAQRRRWARWSRRGPGSGTTGERSTCTAAPGGRRPSTADAARRPRRRCWPCPASARTRPGRSWRSPTSATTSGCSTPTQPGSWPAGPVGRCGPKEAQAAADRRRCRPARAGHGTRRCSTSGATICTAALACVRTVPGAVGLRVAQRWPAPDPGSGGGDGRRVGSAVAVRRLGPPRAWSAGRCAARGPVSRSRAGGVMGWPDDPNEPLGWRDRGGRWPGGGRPR
jgi:hypothetical protein